VDGGDKGDNYRSQCEMFGGLVQSDRNSLAPGPSPSPCAKNAKQCRTFGVILRTQLAQPIIAIR
jgi:hypothetical protein